MADELQKFRDLLRDFDTGILVTHAGNDRLHGRPMAVAQVEDNCDIWFVTGMDTPKMDEIRSNDHVLVTFQNGRDRSLSVRGRAELIRDPQKLDEIWHEEFKAWFPGGKEDPNVALIHVRTDEGEYWDNAGANKVTYTVEALKAYFTNSKPDIKEGKQHGRLSI